MGGTGSSSRWESIASVSYIAGALHKVIPERTVPKVRRRADLPTNRREIRFC